MNWPPILISILALAFTIASFWWLNSRPGILRAWEPRTYVTSATPASGDLQKVYVKIPIVLHNSGATPIVVENMGLVLDSIDTKHLGFVAVHKRIYGPDEEREFATPFSVGGRSTVVRVFEFQRDAPPIKLSDRTPQRFVLWVKAYGERQLFRRWPMSWLPGWTRAEWRPLVTFELLNPIWSGGALVRDNKSDDGPAPDNK